MAAKYSKKQALMAIRFWKRQLAESVKESEEDQEKEKAEKAAKDAGENAKEETPKKKSKKEEPAEDAVDNGEDSADTDGSEDNEEFGSEDSGNDGSDEDVSGFNGDPFGSEETFDDTGEDDSENSDDSEDSDDSDDSEDDTDDSNDNSDDDSDEDDADDSEDDSEDDSDGENDDSDEGDEDDDDADDSEDEDDADDSDEGEDDVKLDEVESGSGKYAPNTVGAVMELLGKFDPNSKLMVRMNPEKYECMIFDISGKLMLKGQNVTYMEIAKGSPAALDEAGPRQTPLMKQFKQWAKSLLKVNPDYVLDPNRLISYIKGPNWNGSDVSYAHYKETISFYGPELLAKFEELRALPDGDAEREYADLLSQSGVKK